MQGTAWGNPTAAPPHPRALGPEVKWRGHLAGAPARPHRRKGQLPAFIPLAHTRIHSYDLSCDGWGVWGRPRGFPCRWVSLRQGLQLGSGELLRAEAPGSELGPGYPRVPNSAQPRPGDHSHAVFHLDRAHPAQASALADVRAVTQQPAATALEVLLVPEREAGGRRARRGGAAHAAAARRTGPSAQRLASPLPGPGPPNPGRGWRTRGWAWAGLGPGC